MTESSSGLYCKELDELIAECDASDPDPDALDRIERHITECPDCQGAESVLSSTVTRFRSLEAAGVSERFEEEIVNRLCGGGSPGSNEANQD